MRAAKCEHTEQRRGYRNGSRKVTIKASTLGKLELSVPRDRDGTFHPRLLEKCSGPDQGLLFGIMEGFVLGLSTSKVVAVVNQLGLGDVSKSHVSRMCMRMEGRLFKYINRPLHGESYEYLIFDAMYSKEYVDGMARRSANYIVIGIDGEGLRRLLALEVGNDESTAIWNKVFRGLKERYLGPVSYVVADQHTDLQEALGHELGSVAVQHCVCHWLRNAGMRMPKKQARATAPLAATMPHLTRMRSVLVGQLSRAGHLAHRCHGYLDLELRDYQDPT